LEVGIYGGVAETPAGFTLAPEQLPAIGALEDAAFEVACSAVLVAEGWALSARHCNPPGGLWYRAGGTDLRTRISRRFPHPARDVALLELEPQPELDALLSAPFSFDAEISGSLVQKPGLLAGFGRSADGTYGDLLFAAEPIVEILQEEIVVDGQGSSGACARDSGGPLLGQEPEHALRLFGVLINGAPSCQGRDFYQRIDTIAQWLGDTIASAEDDPCSGLTWEGTCEMGSAHFCDGWQVYGDSCAPGEVCGFDAVVGGYRCVLPQEDPCLGVGPRGTCRDDRLLVCHHGDLVETDCSACGGQCRQALDGSAACVGNANAVEAQ
jgi:hypothetical protein